MRLESVRARSFGPFRDFTLDLARIPGRVVAITGENGVGKSTILELGLPGAMYRQTPTRGSLVDLATARDALLEARVVNGSPWTLRHLVDKVSGKSEAVVLDEHGQTVLPDSKVRSFDAWAARHLPAPEVLFACMFTPQGAGGFLAAKPTERKATLLRILGVERLEAYAARAVQHREEARTEHQIREAKLADERGRAGDVAELEAALERARGAAAAADEKVAAARAELDAGKTERARIDELEREGKRCSARLAEIDRDLAKARAEQTDVEERLKNNRALLPEAAAIRAAVKQVEKLRKAHAAASSDAEVAKASAARETATVAELQRRLGTLASRVARAREALAGRTAVEAAEKQVPGLEAALQAAEGTLSVATDALEDLRGQHVAGAEERIAVLRGGLEEISSRVWLLEELQRKADTTLEADDAAIALAQELPDQLRVAQAAVQAATTAKVGAERNLAAARATADRRAALDAAAADLELVEREHQEVTTARDEAERGAQGLGQKAKEAAERTAKLASDLATAEIMAKKAERLTTAEARIAELEPQLAALVEREQKLRAERAAVVVPPPIPTPGPMLGLLEGAVAHAEIAAREANAASAVARERLGRARGSAERLGELERERDAAGAELADWSRLAEDLGKNGLQAAEIDAAGPELTTLVNDLLHTCHGPRFTVRVETQRASADGKKMLEGCEVVVLDTERGREAEGETFSGGERVIISEALSLALSMLACRRAGLQGVTLVRDESGAALSPGVRSIYVPMLRRAADVIGADKVLFVSHFEDVIEMADARVEVG